MRGPLSPSVLQASRKAGTRGKAAATKQAQRGSSNVFSMFEQAQIQEFKEVSTVPPAASHSTLSSPRVRGSPQHLLLTTQGSPLSLPPLEKRG